MDDLFFTSFDPMTTEAVNAALQKAGRASGADCGCLTGMRFALHLEGDYAPEELRYELFTSDRLTVTENGTAYDAPYTAATLGDITIMSHLLPGTDRGWHIVIDRRSWAVTAFETWFGVTVPVGIDLFGTKEPDSYRDIPREVQRQYYFGWLDKGDNEKPRYLHTTTNRIEGRGLHWQFSTGYEILTFFPSVVCATLVELGTARGSITVTDPADYIRIDDEHYIFARWEAEFSGKMWIEVMNFFDMNAAGLELGFELDNSLTYRFHTAEIEITGDAGHMEDIRDYGNKKRPMGDRYTQKGGHYTYRPMDIDIPMSREEALRHAREEQHILDASGTNIMESGNKLPQNFDLVGRKFKVWPDNENYAQAPWSGGKEKPWEYWITSKETLKWRRGGGRWIEAKYMCFQPDKNLYFFAHMIEGDPRYAFCAQAVDFTSALTTTVVCGIGNWHSEWEAGARVKFGTLEYGDLQAPFTRRHQFTDELLGKVFAWSYSEKMNSIHVYSSPESYSWTIFSDDNGGGASWSSPCFYIKLRPDVYLFQWVEEKCNGNQGLVVMNRKIQHDGGFFYGVSHGGLSLNITGAYMRELGQFDIKKYFQQT